MGCDHPYIYFLFSCGYLGLFLFLVACSCTYVWLLLFGYDFVFSLFYMAVFDFLFCWRRGSCTHNEDIVSFRCGGGESRSRFCKKWLKIKKN